jgi:endonuclease YncB( thermonuclease family)
MRWNLGMALVSSLGALLAADATSQARDSVWVNARSGVYHCPGTEFYGRTARGEYMGEDAARTRGFRPNGGQRCHAVSTVTEAGPNAAAELQEPRAPVNTEECTLTRITDGDTVDCAPAGTIRLIGMDTPERGQEPYFTAATAALAAWLPLGARLQLESDTGPKDTNGRRLAYVWYEGRMINWLMVRHGWGVALRITPNVRHAMTLDAAERVARAEGRGLWRVDGFRCRPADRRSRSC